MRACGAHAHACVRDSCSCVRAGLMLMRACGGHAHACVRGSCVRACVRGSCGAHACVRAHVGLISAHPGLIHACGVHIFICETIIPLHWSSECVQEHNEIVPVREVFL